MTAPAGIDDFLNNVLDPYQHCADAGRTDGEVAGLARGFSEGQNLGMKKAWEYRFELGYYAGFVEFVAAERGMDVTHIGSKIDEHNGTTKEGRLERNIYGILHAIEEFPTADDLQRASNEEEAEEDDSNKLDLPIQIQRMRAKFKLLLIQLGLPFTFSLVDILNKPQIDNSQTLEAREKVTYDF